MLVSVYGLPMPTVAVALALVMRIFPANARASDLTRNYLSVSSHAKWF
jgi:hypothetical protein